MLFHRCCGNVSPGPHRANCNVGQREAEARAEGNSNPIEVQGMLRVRAHAALRLASRDTHPNVVNAIKEYIQHLEDRLAQELTKQR